VRFRRSRRFRHVDEVHGGRVVVQGPPRPQRPPRRDPRPRVDFPARLLLRPGEEAGQAPRPPRRQVPQQRHHGRPGNAAPHLPVAGRLVVALCRRRLWGRQRRLPPHPRPGAGRPRNPLLPPHGAPRRRLHARGLRLPQLDRARAHLRRRPRHRARALKRHVDVHGTLCAPGAAIYRHPPRRRRRHRHHASTHLLPARDGHQGLRNFRRLQPVRAPAVPALPPHPHPDDGGGGERHHHRALWRPPLHRLLGPHIPLLLPRPPQHQRGRAAPGRPRHLRRRRRGRLCQHAPVQPHPLCRPPRRRLRGARAQGPHRGLSGEQGEPQRRRLPRGLLRAAGRLRPHVRLPRQLCEPRLHARGPEDPGEDARRVSACRGQAGLHRPRVGLPRRDPPPHRVHATQQLRPRRRVRLGMQRQPLGRGLVHHADGLG
jgi:hypothetical protein